MPEENGGGAPLWMDKILTNPGMRIPPANTDKQWFLMVFEVQDFVPQYGCAFLEALFAMIGPNSSDSSLAISVVGGRD